MAGQAGEEKEEEEVEGEDQIPSPSARTIAWWQRLAAPPST